MIILNNSISKRMWENHQKNVEKPDKYMVEKYNLLKNSLYSAEKKFLTTSMEKKGYYPLCSTYKGFDNWGIIYRCWFYMSPS